MRILDVIGNPDGVESEIFGDLGHVERILEAARCCAHFALDRQSDAELHFWPASKSLFSHKWECYGSFFTLSRDAEKASKQVRIAELWSLSSVAGAGSPADEILLGKMISARR
jgi:hypothetical protein